MVPFWFIPALAGHAFTAIAQITDRFLLSRGFQKPHVYAFFVSFAGSIILIAVTPFCIWWGCFEFPGIWRVIETWAASTVFLCALIPFYMAVKGGEPSRVLPAVGGLVSLFTLALAAVFLGEKLLPHYYLAFLFLVAGYMLIGHTGKGFRGFLPVVTKWEVLLSAFLFAVATVLRKDIFATQQFISALLWLGYASAFSASVMLFLPSLRKDILATRQSLPRNNVVVFGANQVTGALSGFLVNYALKLGPASLVQATQGAQYIFVLLLATTISSRYPQILREEISRSVLIQKIIAVLLIGVGLLLIAFV